MKIGIVLPIQDNNIDKLPKIIDSLKEQTIGYKNLVINIVDRTENKDEIYYKITNELLKDEQVEFCSEINIQNLEVDYVSFFDLEFNVGANMLLHLCNKMNENNLDFIAASEKNLTKIQVENDILDSNYFALNSLKLIKKELLEKEEYSFLTGTDDEKVIQYLNFVLYLSDTKYQIAKDAVYHNNINFDDNFIVDSINKIVYVSERLFKKYGQALNEKARFLLIKHIMFLIDKNVFLDEVEEEYQIRLYQHLSTLLDTVSESKYRENNIWGYKPFFNLINKGLYDEATQYMKLLRSRRYWFEESQRLESYFEKNPHDLKDSASWKITRPFRVLERNFIVVKDVAYKWTLIFIAFIIRIVTFGNPIWLIGEREDQAEDNGYFFYKYCREEHPKKNIYYVINKKSPHLEKVAKYKNVIYHSSFKHKVFMLAAEVYISAWIFEEGSYPNPKEKFSQLFKKQLLKKYNISIQHGVIIQNISPYLRQDKYNIDFIIASSEKEKKIIQTTLGYKPEDIEITGLARFDNLHNIRVKKQILIMPTWRRSLSNSSKSDFLKSDYFKMYKNLLNNATFLKTIEENNISVKFYIHNQMQKFLKYFIVDHPNIEFLNKENSTVSELLKESALLITDYSSVSLDFLYMNKPVLLYQFDPENNHHVPSKEIKYSDIGIIVSKEEELMKNMERIVANKLKIDAKYIQNSKRIFKYKDNHNCKRIYEVIKKRTAK